MTTRKMHSQNLHITEQVSNQERWNTWNKTLSRFSVGLYTAVCIYIYIVTSAFCDLMSSEIIILSKLGAWHGIIAAQQDLNDNITIEQLYSYIHRVEAPASIGPPGDSVIEGRKSWNFEKKTSLKMSCDQGTPHLHFVVDLLLPGVSAFFSLRTMAHWPNCFSARFDVFLLWSTELDCQTLTIRWWRFVSICGCHFRIIFNDDILQQVWINDVLSSFSCWTVTVCGEKKLFVPRWRNVHGQSNICLWLSIFHSAVDPLILVDSAGARPSQLFSEARHTPFTKLQAKAGSGRRTTVDDILWKKTCWYGSVRKGAPIEVFIPCWVSQIFVWQMWIPNPVTWRWMFWMLWLLRVEEDQAEESSDRWTSLFHWCPRFAKLVVLPFFVINANTLAVALDVSWWSSVWALNSWPIFDPFLTSTFQTLWLCTIFSQVRSSWSSTNGRIYATNGRIATDATLVATNAVKTSGHFEIVGHNLDWMSWMQLTWWI